jgi:integrase
MPRRSTGQVVERRRARGIYYGLRFYAGGERHYVSLGTAEEGWNHRRAEDELAATMAAVRAGTWEPPMPTAPIAPAEPERTFHEFASDWFRANEAGWKVKTRKNYKWQLSHHLLPFFKDHLLRQITVAEVDRYREAEQRDGKLSAEQINKTITRLGQILDVADERELIDRNPVRVNPKRRKLKTPPRRLAYLDSPGHIVAVLDAASELDAKPTAKTSGRRAFMATLVFAGLRISEACDLKRHHVDLANGRISVPGTKTDAAFDDVNVLPVLRDELAADLARRGEVGPYEPMFPNARGGHRTDDNARQRVIDPVVERAQELALKRTGRPLPDGVTAHALRRTFISLLLVHDPDPVYAMTQARHTDPTLTIRVYAQLMRRSPEERAALKALINGSDWAPTGTSEPQEASADPDGAEAAQPRNGSHKR